MPLASSSARGGSAERTGARRDVEQRSPPSGARPDLAPNDLYSVCGLREQVDVEPTTPPRARPSDRGRARPVTMTTGSAESEPAALAPVGVRQAESVPRRQRRGRRRDGRRRASMSVRHRKEIRDHLGRSPELGSATRSPPYKPQATLRPRVSRTNASHVSTRGLCSAANALIVRWVVRIHVSQGGRASPICEGRRRHNGHRQRTAIRDAMTRGPRDQVAPSSSDLPSHSSSTAYLSQEKL